MLIASTVVVGGAITAQAKYVYSTSTQPEVGNTSLPGHDRWNRGQRNPGNGYVMAYSYYYNDSYWHKSKATLNGEKGTDYKAPGQTTTANSPHSYPSSSSYGFIVSAGIGDY